MNRKSYDGHCLVNQEANLLFFCYSFTKNCFLQNHEYHELNESDTSGGGAQRSPEGSRSGYRSHDLVLSPEGEPQLVTHLL